MANLFPKSINLAPTKILVALVLTASTLVAGITYYFTPSYSRVGYQPIQPVAFNHNLHVEQLGMDCRYCHTYVDRSSHSNVPATSTCMNCHSQVQKQAPSLEVVRNSYETGEPIPWVRVHKTPEYVYFNHAAHVNRGVSCVECHGQVNEMTDEGVYHAEPLSMAFCLECHRNPEYSLRPNEEVYNLDWQPPGETEAERAANQLDMGTQFVHDWRVLPPQSCSGCHR